MNFRKNILLIVAIAVTFLLVNFSLNPKYSVAQQDENQQDVKWDYLAVSYQYNNQQEKFCSTDANSNSKLLASIGKNGWELVLYHDIYDMNGEIDKCQEAVFKKRRSPTQITPESKLHSKPTQQAKTVADDQLVNCYEN